MPSFFDSRAAVPRSMTVYARWRPRDSILPPRRVVSPTPQDRLHPDVNPADVITRDIDPGLKEPPLQRTDMANEEAEEEEEVESTVEVTEGTTEEDSITLDVEAIDTYQNRIEELTTELEERERTVEELESTVEEQSEQIDRLESQFLDLSARVADGRNLGVCPECNGPTEKKERLFRSDTIECNRCGKVIHTY